MYFSDFSSILTWWFVFLLIGIVFLPFTTVIFSRFLDRGYIFAKILGMLLVSYAIFVSATLKILPFSQTSILICLFAFAIVSIVLLYRFKEIVLGLLGSSWKLFLFEEFLFFACLLFWSYVRAHEPSIHGLEKYMDFGFVNSILRTDYFPAKDLWLTPLSINYYYFGHLVTAVLTKLSGIDQVVTFNLMIVTLFAFTFTCAFSIGLNLMHMFLATQKFSASKIFRVSVVAGLLTAFLVAFAGNLHTIYAFFAAYEGEHPVPFWHLAWDFDFSNYWYPNATRFIPFTIHEFPLYSFVVSDLHGHVLSIPIVLTIIALLLSLLISKSEIRNPKQSQNSNDRNSKRFENSDFEHSNLFRVSIFDIRFLLLSFLLAAAYMTNAWDGLIYFALSGLVIVYVLLKGFRWQEVLKPQTVANVLMYILPLGLGFFIFALPFSIHFKPFVSGIGIVKDHSPLYMILILWGFFYFFAVSFLLFLRKKEQTVIDTFVLILIFLSTLLLIFPEFFYAKDIYPAHYRANTMFKLGYQAFMMLSICSAYIIIRIVLNIKHYVLQMSMKGKVFVTCYLLLVTSLLFLVGIYPYFAINSYYGNVKVYKGLDGLVYLRDLYPDDYEAILWMRDNIQGQSVILEGAGESYTDYARVSANTGIPTVVGWPVHEWLWRGSYDEAGKRVAEVEQAYTTADIAQTTAFLKKYKVEYVFVGTLERQKYPALNEGKFKTLGEPIYQNGQTTVYKIK